MNYGTPVTYTHAGPTCCLKCQRTFNSKDVIRLRICPKCTAVNESVGRATVCDTPQGHIIRKDVGRY